jgi:copper chaperone
MITTTFAVTGMTCSHCVAAVTQEVAKIRGVTSVEVDLSTGSVTVESDGAVDPTAFAEAIDEAGYEVAS